MIHDHDFLNLSLGKNCEDLAQLMLGGYENHGSAGITQSVGGLLRGQCGIDGDGDGAEQQDGEIGGGPFGTILAKDGDAVALVDAPFLQRVRGSGDVAAEVGRRDGQPLSMLTVQHGAVEIAFGGGEENIV